MSLRPLVSLLLPTLSAMGVESPSPVPAPAPLAPPVALVTPALLPPEATLQIQRSASALPPGSDHFPAPLDVWADPGALASRTQVANQLSALLRGSVPAESPFADGFVSLSWAIQPAMSTDPDRNHPRSEVVVEHALAATLATAVAGLLPLGKAQTVRGFVGSGDATLFAGAKDHQLLIGDPVLLENRLPPAIAVATASTPAAALTFHFDFTSVLALVKKLEIEGISYNLDPILPRWRAEAPQLNLTVNPTAQGWQSQLKFSARSLPVHEVDPDFAKLLVDGKQVRALLGITPVAVSQLIANMLASDEMAKLEGRIGLPLDRAAECFTGDVALLIQADGLIPQGCMAFGLQANTRSKLLATHLAQMWNGELLPAPNANTTLWTLETPLGPWELGLTPTRLVFGNDPDLLHSVLTGTVTKATVPGHVVGFLDCDLPHLCKQWLPMLWPLLSTSHINLADDPLLNLSFQLPRSQVL